MAVCAYRETCGIDQDKLLLHNSVHSFCLQDLFGLEAIVKYSKAATDNRLGCSASAAHCPGKSDARRPITAVVNIILAFESQAVTQRQVRPSMPIVWRIESGIVGGQSFVREPGRNGELGGVGNPAILKLLLSVFVRNRAW